MEKQIKNFYDMEVWKLGHEMVIDVYQISKSFPKEEQFGITNQIRRAAS